MSIYIYKNEDKKFSWVTNSNITPKGEEINPIALGLDTHSRYLFYADFKPKLEGVDYSLGGTFTYPAVRKETPPYSLLITGKFIRVKDGTIIYKGGFSIV